MATITTLRSGLDTNTAVWSGGVIPTDGDKVTISKLGTAVGRTLSAAVSAGATSIPITAGTGTIVVGECIEFNSQRGIYYEVTGPGAVGATALSTGAGSITVSPAVDVAQVSGAALTSRGHCVTLTTSRTFGDDTTTGITLNGTLLWSTTASASLTCKGTITIAATGRVDMGTALRPISDPTVIAQLLLNYSATMADNKYNLTKQAGGEIKAFGYYRNRRTLTTSALAIGGTTVTVDDATGWRVGDEVMLSFTESSSTYAGTFLTSPIGAGYTNGSTSIPITTAPTTARASGCRIINTTANVIISPYNTTFKHANSVATTSVADGVYCENATIIATASTVQAGWGFGSATLAVGYQANYKNVCFRSIAGSTSFFVFSGGCKIANSIAVDSDTGIFSYCSIPFPAQGSVLTETTVFRTNNTARFPTSGVNNQNPSAYGAISDFDVHLFSNSNVSDTQLLLTQSSPWSGLVFNDGNSGAVSNRLGVYAPGAVFSGDFGSTSRAAGGAFSSAYQGTTYIKASRLPDASPSLSFGLVPGLYIHLQSCYKRSTPSVVFDQMWTNGGTATRTNAQRKNGNYSWEFQTLGANILIDHSFTAPIAIGETKTLLVNLRRDSTYGAGSVPKVTLTIPGQASVVSAMADVANTWDKQTVSITNTTGASAELTVQLAATGPTLNGKAWFDGIPIQPYVPAVRWYGYIFDEANPFRVVDPTITLSEAAAGAITGVAVDHTAQTITVTAARTAAEIYCYCILDLVNNLGSDGNYRTKHISSSDGASFATTYTVVLSGGGSIAGRYSDVNGAVVSASVTNIVTGSRILIRRTDTNAVLSNSIVGGTSHSINIQTAVAIPITVDVRKGSAAPYYQGWATSGVIDPVAGFTATANQQPD